MYARHPQIRQLQPGKPLEDMGGLLRQARERKGTANRGHEAREEIRLEGQRNDPDTLERAGDSQR